MEQSLIKTVYVHLTRKCNLSCKYCYFNAGEAMQDELTLDEFKSLAKEIELLNPAKVVFTGGEPLLRTDLFDIAKAFREPDSRRLFKLCLISNGTLIDHLAALNISKTFDEVRISLDGKAEVNDKLRGTGTYERVLDAISQLKNAGIFPGISITLNSENICDLSKFLSFLLLNGIATDFHLSPLRSVGRGTQYPDLTCSSEEAHLAVADFWKRHFGVEPKFNGDNEKQKSGCSNCGVGSYINIHPDGSVYPCHVLSDEKFLLGNVRQKKLSEIVSKSELFNYLRTIDFAKLKGGILRSKEIPSKTLCLGELLRDAPEDFLNLQSSVRWEP